MNPIQARPAALPTGTLDYYVQRARDFEDRHPGESAPNYYRDYGDKYVRTFDQLKDRLSPAGENWVDETRRNLQESFEQACRRDPAAFARLEEDPKALRRFAFGSHSGAYLEAGLARLPARDLVTIGLTPDWKDSLNPQGLKEIAKVVGPVVRERPNLLVSAPAEVLGRLPGALRAGLQRMGTTLAGLPLPGPNPLWFLR